MCIATVTRFTWYRSIHKNESIIYSDDCGKHTCTVASVYSLMISMYPLMISAYPLIIWGMHTLLCTNCRNCKCITHYDQFITYMS